MSTYVPRRNGYRVDNVSPVFNANVIIVITDGKSIEQYILVHPGTK